MSITDTESPTLLATYTLDPDTTIAPGPWPTVYLRSSTGFAAAASITDTVPSPPLVTKARVPSALNATDTGL